jgi:hypothetical protein
MMATSKRRLPMRRTFSILSVVLGASLMVLPAVLADTGSGPVAVAGGTEPALDLSSQADINAYLTSIGVDPADLVVQEGDQNYAGPNCPGADWTCTQDTDAILQVSSSDDDDDGDDGDDDDGENVFVCSPQSTGTDPDTNTCVIMQTNTTGSNRAVCREHNEQEEGTVEQTCTITQTNVSGQNIAIVDQSVEMGHDDTTQRSEQRSSITQSNGSGSNWAGVSQRSNLSTEAEDEEDADVFQQQDVIQDYVVAQETGVGLLPTAQAGANRADLFQSHRLEAEVEEAESSEQRQNFTPPLGTDTSCGPPHAPVHYLPNVCAVFDQDSTNGELLINLRQILRHHAEAEDVEGEAFQQQGSGEFTGGLAGIFHQDSTGRARRFKFQDERQIADAEGTTQRQFTGQGPRMNSNQMSNPADIANGTQTVVQLASDPDRQQASLEGLVGPTLGTATFRQFVRQQDETRQQTVTGTGTVVATIKCEHFAEEGDFQECFVSSEDESPPPTLT